MKRLIHKLTNAVVLFMNGWGNNIPSRHFRMYVYRALGAKIGQSIIFRKTELLEPQKLLIGDHVSIGWHCLIDARGGLAIGDNVNISSYVRIITAGHDVKSSSFEGTTGRVRIDKNVWLATGCTVLEGVHIGEGAVVACGAVVTKDVPPFTVVGGIPARKISERVSLLSYEVELPPILY